MIPKIKRYSNIIIRLLDIGIVIICYLASAIFITNKLDLNSKTLILQLLISTVLFQLFLSLFKLYKNILRYEIGNDYTKYALCALMYINSISIFDVFIGYFRMYFKTNILAGLLSAGVMITYRMFARNFINSLDKKNLNYSKKKPLNLLIIGAGSNAREIVLQIKINQVH